VCGVTAVRLDFIDFCCYDIYIKTVLATQNIEIHISIIETHTYNVHRFARSARRSVVSRRGATRALLSSVIHGHGICQGGTSCQGGISLLAYLAYYLPGGY